MLEESAFKVAGYKEVGNERQVGTESRLLEKEKCGFVDGCVQRKEQKSLWKDRTVSRRWCMVENSPFSWEVKFHFLIPCHTYKQHQGHKHRVSTKADHIQRPNRELHDD